MELTRIQHTSISFISSFALRCAVDLDISGRIREHGRPMPLNELARSIPIPPEKDSMLLRLMALLVHQGYFVQSEAGYQITPLSEHISTEGSDVGAYVRLVTEVQLLKDWDRLSDVFKDTSKCTLIDKLYEGKQFFEVVKEIPKFGNLYNEAMASTSKSLMRGLLARYPHIFEGIKSLVDVGGGTGAAVRIIAEAFPTLKCTVFDLPHVVENATKTDFIDVVGGDMFQKIPPADAYFLKNVLHDWADEDCIRILKQCKEAIESSKHGGKVIVIDIILDSENDDPKAVETSLLLDISMMCLHGSQERNKQEWHDIILGAGYSGYKIYPVQLGVYSVIELCP
ncbi:hypothetical protein LUZ61_011505 [Rhynchospora tenuis]|uniref:O-methyltransferase n=1 Tax=Rhynchospora tenuis TaxID=198213 RepID=A0AAD6F0H9_9POAL|nr:hypothetical protein LUZ61_011505 [Rhynchospora tenuis]